MWGRKKLWPTDPDTGMPEIPAGFKWKVTSEKVYLMYKFYQGDSTSHVWVKKGLFGGYWVRESAPYYTYQSLRSAYLSGWDEIEPMEEYIFRLASKIRYTTQEEVEKLSKQYRVRTVAHKHSGAYPPKKL